MELDREIFYGERSKKRSAINYTSKSMFSESIFIILGVFTIAFIHYKTLHFVTMLLQLVLLFLYYRSPKNYPWIFILMFISFSPGSLFHSRYATPFLFINIPALGVITFEMMFILVSWVKTHGEKVPILYYSNYMKIILYFFVLFFIFGGRIIMFLRILIYFSWLVLIPKLLFKREEFDRLFYLIIIMSIVTLLINIYEVITVSRFVSIFTVYMPLRTFSLFDEELVRTAGGIQFSLLSIIGGLIYLSQNKSPISHIVLYIGIFVGIINILFSGTRGWIIAIIFLLISYSLFLIPRLIKNAILIIPIIIIAFGIVWQIPILRKQIVVSINRTLYYQNLIDLDFNPETTQLDRIAGNPRIMQKFKENPVIGWGFGTTGREYADSHTGNQSMLLNFGVVGFGLFLIFWIGFIRKLLSTDNFFSPRLPDYRINILIVLSFFTVFIIHSTSGAMLHPMIIVSAVFWYSMIFAYGNFHYNQQIAQQKIKVHEEGV